MQNNLQVNEGLASHYVYFSFPRCTLKEMCRWHNHDGLTLLHNTTAPKMDSIRKDVIKTFKDLGFKIDIKTNLKVVDFLDATFNLSNGTYKPYKKPNNTLLYINTSSNHPPQVIKQLPSSIADRLSKNSSNKEMFNKTKPEYEKALKDSGYDSVELNYNQNKQRESRRNRNRNIIWFNPPFSRTVSTNVAKRFFNLLDYHSFPQNQQTQ